MNNKKILDIISQSFFAVLFIYAIYYIAERVIYLDSAAQLFEMINAQSFKIYVGRYTMYIQQFLPVMAIKVGLPLKIVLLSYSLSFYIITYLVFLYIRYRVKSTKGVVLLLLSTIGVSHTFFHSISETYQLLIFGSLFYVTINQKINSFFYLLINSILIVIMYYIHPVSVFFIAFVIGFKFLDKLNFKDYKIYILFLFFIALASLKLLFPDESSHDAKFLNELKYFDELFDNLLNLASTQYFIKNFFTVYIIPTILLVITTVYYILNKKFLKLLFVNGFIFSFLLLSLIIYNKGDFPIGMERSFLPLYIFVLIPFVSDVLFSLKKHILVSSILLVLLLSNEFINIVIASDKYVKSIKDTEYLLSKMEKKGVSKAQFFSDEIKPIFTNWSSSFESLLLSSLKGKDSSKTFFLQENYDFTLRENTDSMFFMTYFWKYTTTNRQKFNSKYFNLPLEPYEVMYNFNPIMFVDNETTELDEHVVRRSNDTIYYSTDSRDTTYSFSGKYSSKTDSISPYRLIYNFDTPIGVDSIKISVKRKGGTEGNLVFDNDTLYLATNMGDTLKNDWVNLEMVISKEYLVDNRRTFIVYVWNSGKQPIWFDDLIIEIYKSNN